MAIHAAQAINYIAFHGHVAFITPDGLLANTWVIDKRDNPEVDYGDTAYEEPAVFPIDNNGMVDMGSIRAWLGY